MVNRRTLFRRLFKTTVGGGAAVLLWRSRVIQVASFLAAAGVNRIWQMHDGPGPSPGAVEWPESKPATLKAPTPKPLMLITYHPEYHSFDPKRVLASLNAAKDLGVAWIRTDLRWNRILSSNLKPDSETLTWYRNFLAAISSAGLKSMVVLSSPPNQILSLPGHQKLNSWRSFVEIVIDHFGAACDVYQLMNEPNNPIYRFFSMEDAATAINHAKEMFQASAHPAKIAVNIAMDIWGWREYVTNLLERSGASIDIIGLDHYPGTWTVGVHEHWDQAIKLSEVIAKAPPGSPWFKRQLMIMETGFCTNTISRGENQQLKYFERILEIAQQLRGLPSTDLPLLGLYELCDRDTTAFMDPEAHFGLLTSDLKPKLAFEMLRRKLAYFG